MKLGQEGSSIIEALISVGLVSLAAASFAQALENFNAQQSRADRNVAVQELMVQTATLLMRQDFHQITQECARVLNRSPRCLNQAQTELTEASAPDPLALPGTERRMDRLGHVTTSGDYCVEIAACRDLGTDRVKEIRLHGYYRIQGSAVSISQRSLEFRKGRW